MTVTERMKMSVRKMQRGIYGISDAEYEINCIIEDEVNNAVDGDDIEAANQRIEMTRKLKRKAWRMLLEATK